MPNDKLGIVQAASDRRHGVSAYMCVIPPRPPDCPHWTFRLEARGGESPVLQWHGATREDAMHPPEDIVHGFLWRVFGPYHTEHEEA